MTNAYYVQVQVVPSKLGNIQKRCLFLDFRGYPVIRANELVECSPFYTAAVAKRHAGHYIERLVAIGKAEDSLTGTLRSLIGDNTEDFNAQVVIDIIQITGTTLLDATIQSIDTVTIEIDYHDGGKETSVGVTSILDKAYKPEVKTADVKEVS